MRRSTRARSVVDSMEYWVKWTLLSLYGPASQDRDTDPIEQLKREYGRPPSP
jgi:hypothetical protein